jgi:hypothetical protein
MPSKEKFSLEIFMKAWNRFEVHKFETDRMQVYRHKFTTLS